MATFTSNPWVTGEIITADGLNGDKGYVVTLSEDEYNGSWTLNIGTGFTSIDFLLKFKFNFIDDGTPFITTANQCIVYEEDNIIEIYPTNGKLISYNFSTGILSNVVETEEEEP